MSEPSCDTVWANALPFAHDIWGTVERCTDCDGYLQHHDERRLPCASCERAPYYRLAELVKSPASFAPTQAVPTSRPFRELIFRARGYDAKHRVWTYGE